jgi:hypothetical protein
MRPGTVPAARISVSGLRTAVPCRVLADPLRAGRFCVIADTSSI